MAMAPATRGLIARVLRQREAVGRAGVAAAEQARAERVADEARLAEEVAQERAFAREQRVDMGALGAMLGVVETAWRDAAAARTDAAQHATRQAETQCDAARAALAETARTVKGFDLLMERQDEERARREARRDTLPQMMVLTHGKAD